MPAPPAWSALRHGRRRYLADLRASRAFVASEVTDTGWLSLGQFRWRDVSPGRAARAAFGVLVPLAAGIATGHPEYGTFAALGALPAGFVSFRGVTRTRVPLVAITAAGMAISTFVGAATAAGSPWLLVPEIAAWAYVAGVCAALGPSATAVSLQWPVALLIGSAIPLGPGQAAVRAGLVLAGGLAQALVSAGHRLALAALALEAAVDAHHCGQHPAAVKPDAFQAQLDHLADLVRQAAAQLAEGLRRMRPPGPLPPLREVQSRLPPDRADALLVATDGLVDALNTTADIMRRYLSPAARSGKP